MDSIKIRTWMWACKVQFTVFIAITHTTGVRQQQRAKNDLLLTAEKALCQPFELHQAKISRTTKNFFGKGFDLTGKVKHLETGPS